MRRTPDLFRRGFVVPLSALLLSACAGDGRGAPGGCEQVTVLAASSFAPALRDPAADPCVTAWQVSSGSSTALAAQVLEGAPADVLVSAGTKAVEQLTGAGLTVGEPVSLGSVRATLLVSSTRDGQVDLRDLPQRVAAGWKVGLCVASAPCGAMADKVLANATALWGDGYDRRSVAATEAASAEDLVAKVTVGEIDAALIYEYVCEQPAGAAGVCNDIPDTVDGAPLNVSTPYVAVRLRDSEAAEAFVATVTSARFRLYLARRMRIS